MFCLEMLCCCGPLSKKARHKEKILTQVSKSRLIEQEQEQEQEQLLKTIDIVEFDRQSDSSIPSICSSSMSLETVDTTSSFYELEIPHVTV